MWSEELKYTLGGLKFNYHYLNNVSVNTSFHVNKAKISYKVTTDS